MVAEQFLNAQKQARDTHIGIHAYVRRPLVVSNCLRRIIYFRFIQLATVNK